jgi:uncharacterized protein (DUF1697 family)
VTTTWIGLLRGVNVGGNTIRSADLVEAVAAAGFRRVRAVLASGNLLVEAEEDADRSAVRGLIERAIDERYGYGVAVVALTSDELQRIIADYPFDEVAEKHPYVTFATDRSVMTRLIDEASRLPGYWGALDDLAGATSGQRVVGQSDTADVERLAGGDEVIYWEVTKGSSTDSPFAKLTARSTYRSGAETVTTRNLRTLRKLVW